MLEMVIDQKQQLGGTELRLHIDRDAIVRRASLNMNLIMRRGLVFFPLGSNRSPFQYPVSFQRHVSPPSSAPGASTRCRPVITVSCRAFESHSDLTSSPSPPHSPAHTHEDLLQQVVNHIDHLLWEPTTAHVYAHDLLDRGGRCIGLDSVPYRIRYASPIRSGRSKPIEKGPHLSIFLIS
jgi:hypothetical protein